MVLNGDALLDIRDEMELVKGAEEYSDSQRVEEALKHYLRSQGWVDGIGAFRKSLRDLRTACYIVVASVSGCRNHELALLQSGACYSTVESVGGTVENDETITYWWMRSQSLKTGEGHTEWMVPEAAVTALGVMDRWAKPYQARIEAEIALRRAADPLDPEIEEARQHIKSVFLAATRQKSNEIRTMSGQAWGLRLKAFAKKCGVNWNLATHQFRRKFANYSAHSQFGDLRYLREHFKHWSMDMTLGYALNESQEMGLYIEIQDELDDIKAGLVDSWLQPDELLAGGYGAKIMAWRGVARNPSPSSRTTSKWCVLWPAALPSVVMVTHGARRTTINALATILSARDAVVAKTLSSASDIKGYIGDCTIT
jgi:integrase